ncbi:MAG TPA: CPBP family intramembrane metalloprotease [Planctomycetes bacterium]|nr:CPBP family intramembrane metalloprotease [Planctomycetota bacterium]
MTALCALGVMFLLYWLSGRAGPVGLGNCPDRRHNLPVYLPFVLMAVWAVVVFDVMAIIELAAAESPPWRREVFKYLALSIIELVLIVFFVCFARQSFVRRLTGFGLNLRTITGDFVAAVVNLISVLPLVLLGILLTIHIGRFLAGPDFEMQTNEGLAVVTEHPQQVVRMVMFFFLVLIAPVFEEMLFRGILQSVMRGLTGRPWEAIVITSLFFAVSHPNTHFPPLFVLSCCMGYAYEKSGSLFRPIFIHAMFNAASVTAALTN